MQYCLCMPQPWIVVLAGGEGSRVRSITRSPDGEDVPKQFCRLLNGQSLFRTALARARRLTAEARVVPVVRAQHRRWWARDLRGIDPGLLLSQHESRGTAHAVFLALIAIARRDPDASAVFLPSDTMIDHEDRFHGAVIRLHREAEAWNDRVMLLGAEPGASDRDYGWIVPDEELQRGTRRVVSFVEKPPREEARALRLRGGLVNTFVTAARVRVLLELFRLCLPDLVAAHHGQGENFLHPTRERRTWDLSRDLLAHTTSWQRVRAVAPCGWCDLGTPDRLSRWLAEHRETFVWERPRPETVAR